MLVIIRSNHIAIYLIVAFHFLIFPSSQELVRIINHANIIRRTVVIHRNPVIYLIVEAIILAVSLRSGYHKDTSLHCCVPIIHLLQLFFQ